MNLFKKLHKLSGKNNCIMLLSFIICMIFSLVIIYKIESNNYLNLREKTEYVTNSQVSRLQYVINTLLLKTQTLEMLVVEGNGQISNFDQIAESLYDNNAIRSLQLAPNGNVTYVYPLKGNEDAFGDLFSDKERAAEAILARDSGKMTLSGPFELYQGGLGVIARRPIYLTDSNNQKQFWGFSIIVLDLPQAFYPAKLDNFTKEGFEYKLYRINPETKKVQIIDESSNQEMKNPTESSFYVPNGTWIFSVMPRGGWFNLNVILAEVFIGILFSMMVTIIIITFFRFIQQKEILYHTTITDRLTGLKNYMKLMQQLEENISSKIPYVLFFMDLNGFKRVNDTYGHTVGNMVLVETAQRLQSCFHFYGDVFRNGGDEFCAIVPQKQDESFYQQLLEKVSACFEEPFLVDGHSIYCSISIGYSRYPEDNENIEKLIHLADVKMYQMKHQLNA